jgi:hypothetical protein
MRKEMVRAATWFLIWIVLLWLNPSPNDCSDQYLRAGDGLKISRQ